MDPSCLLDVSFGFQKAGIVILFVRKDEILLISSLLGFRRSIATFSSISITICCCRQYVGQSNTGFSTSISRSDISESDSSIQGRPYRASSMRSSLGGSSFRRKRESSLVPFSI